MVRVDAKNGKKYNENNVPLDRDRLTRYYTKSGKQFFIKNMDSITHRDVAWNNGCFIGDYYAVFSLEPGEKIAYQVSPWYFKYGNAERKMEELGKNAEVVSEHFSGRVH